MISISVTVSITTVAQTWTLEISLTAHAFVRLKETFHEIIEAQRCKSIRKYYLALTLQVFSVTLIVIMIGLEQ